MANESHNKTNWINKLEDTEGLSGEILPDKIAVWKQLQSRLHDKPRRKKLIWFWTVAACLLIALLIPFILIHRKQSALSKNTVPDSEIIKPQVRGISPSGETAIITVKPEERKSMVKNKAVNTLKADNINKDSSETNPPASGNELVLSLPVMTDSTADTTIVAANPRKKLRVVHINELGDPIEESADIAHNTEQHTFQLKLANQEVFTNTSVAYNKTRFTILKTKSSPTN